MDGDDNHDVGRFFFGFTSSFYPFFFDIYTYILSHPAIVHFPVDSGWWATHVCLMANDLIYFCFPISVVSCSSFLLLRLRADPRYSTMESVVVMFASGIVATARALEV